MQLGLYERLVTAGLLPDVEGLADAGLIADLARLDDADGPRLLARHVARVLEGLLGDLHPEDRITVANAALNALTAHAVTTGAERVADIAKPVLRAVSLRAAGPMSVRFPRPEISLSVSDLLVNGRGEPSLIRALTSEIASSNERIRIIVSFIRWTGVRLVLEVLEQARSRGVDVQVLTTTYMGASEKRAIDELVRIGAELKVSYDGRSSRLHAKGWLFERKTGFHTAYIGSSNLSGAAMVDGQEWNIRLSQAETPHLLDKFRATFEAYWADPVHGFEPYALGDPLIEDRLTRALQQHSDASRHTDSGEGDLLPFDITPYPFQRRSSTTSSAIVMCMTAPATLSLRPPVPARPCWPRSTTDGSKATRVGGGTKTGCHGCYSWPTGRRFSVSPCARFARCCTGPTLVT